MATCFWIWSKMLTVAKMFMRQSQPACIPFAANEVLDQWVGTQTQAYEVRREQTLFLSIPCSIFSLTPLAFPGSPVLVTSILSQTMSLYERWIIRLHQCSSMPHTQTLLLSKHTSDCEGNGEFLCSNFLNQHHRISLQGWQGYPQCVPSHHRKSHG